MPLAWGQNYDGLDCRTQLKDVLLLTKKCAWVLVVETDPKAIAQPIHCNLSIIEQSSASLSYQKLAIKNISYSG
ncbi:MULTISPECIES: hypothetical protein [unclassified Candidatus Cardinium]|uniref:hypothetical protein n=1 Tax=unclassified Candidatus Cardinium TaxID=2641185 RepID=UPI001FB2560F|nr:MULTISPECIES: hypothetical protein [unclassified Candidatus Cardinium]